jgi:UDP-N-acetylenolpyruvoylglucosamine reductase
MANEQSVIVGVCRDISIGGLQVLTEKIPGSVGAKIKMNISPSADAFGKAIAPFVAEGVIVRILEDGRGFSFRFEKLPEKSRQAIESYIESSK